MTLSLSPPQGCMGSHYIEHSRQSWGRTKTRSVMHLAMCVCRVLLKPALAGKEVRPISYALRMHTNTPSLCRPEPLCNTNVARHVMHGDLVWGMCQVLFALDSTSVVVLVSHWPAAFPVLLPLCFTPTNQQASWLRQQHTPAPKTCSDT